ncbi:MAG: hypothetical protein JSR69_23330, partial [Proteobacteria bacterium]|nr:hypothetical protein [Pseudomonadota bacterium]
MKTLFSNWVRIVGVATTVFLIAMSLMLLVAWHFDSQAPSHFWTAEEIMTRLFAFPTFTAALVVTWSLLGSPSIASATASSSLAPITLQHQFKAQVVGVQWMNPLVRRDYPTEWQLLWTQGLATPNKNDEVVKEKPKKFSSVQPVAAIVWNINGTVTFPNFFSGYMEEILHPFGSRYAMNADYFYTIQPKSSKDWRELAGIHIEFALPDTPLLTGEKATHIVQNAMNEEFEFYDPELSTRDIPADVHVSVGGASVGFTSLTAALDYLKTHPKESVWAMTWDSPDHPKDEQMTENCVLL